MGESISELLETATTVARGAGQLLRQHFHEARQVEYKGGIDLVTDADRLSEAHVLSALRTRHPTHAILSEEAGIAEPGTAPFRWIVDPLDGTTNYAHQVPHFCVSIGVEQSGRVVAGAVYDPLQDELFAAGKGQGATLNGRPLRASATCLLDKALLVTGFPYDVHQRPELPVRLVTRFVTRAQGIRRMGSAALDLCYVAAGRFDGYFEFGLHPWDVAAGSLIVQEAGGVLTDLGGAPFQVMKGDVLASAPGLAAQMRAECRQVLLELGHVPGSEA